MPVIDPVLNIGVDVAVVNWAANYNCIGIHDVKEGEVGSVAKNDMSMEWGIWMMLDMRLQSGVDSTGHIPCHFGYMRVVLGAVHYENGDIA
mmetsp:Transcript_17567/g.36905  ORF Transcript_17567/g.36905 Transcript_17567/m.36905 type:complete len:91 (-) Transcript_17567:1613-1885(-)